jgi:ketosteroid isomerase-like protein
MSSAATPFQDIDRVVRALDEDFIRNANAQDAAAITEGFYAEDAQLLPPHSPLIRGRAAIRGFWEAFLAKGATDFLLDTEQVVASGDLAYGTGRYELTMGGARQEGKYVVVYQRQEDGGYKAVVDAFNPDA